MYSETTEVPKTRKERLNALSVGENFLIQKEKRSAWANLISNIHGATDKKWSIQEIDGETRVWRLK